MTAPPAPTPSPAARVLERVVDVRPNEMRAMFLACAYFFFLLCSYFILRPIRDEISVAAGTNKLPWLFLGTLIATLVINPFFSALVVKLPVRKFVPLSYRFFIANLLIFFVLVRFGAESSLWFGAAFFIWTSVFNLFVVSVFWGFMADSFNSEQGKRLFGFIGFGGTAGAIVGSAITATLVERLGTVNLLLMSAVLLEVAVQVVRRFPAMGHTREEREKMDVPIGGGLLSGIKHIAASPYLLGICVYMLLFTIGSTFLYFQQTDIVGRTYADRAQRTSFLAWMDFSVQTLTIITQLFLTGRILKKVGVGVTLAIVPALSTIGFLALGFLPTLAVFVGFHVLRRAGEFALTRPAREVLYTVIRREDKYKAKSFIDTFVYRAGDQVAAWSNAAMGALGMAAGGIALTAVPVSAIWMLVGLWLGRRQSAMVREGPSGPSEPVRAAAPAVA